MRPRRTYRPLRRTKAPGSACRMSASASKRISEAGPIAASARLPVVMKYPSPYPWMKMTDEQRLKILIADDEPLAAERLQMMLARIEAVDLVGTAHDGESA